MSVTMSPKEIFHANPDCICTLDGQGTVLSINPRGVQLWEFDSASDGLGKNYADLWLTEERERILDAIDEALAGRASVMEGFCVTPKGNRYWWETRFLPIDSKSNGTERIMCISRDFSQRQQMQLSHSAQEIKDRAQNALYREIIDSAIETAIIGTDTEGRIVLWSEGAHQITGWEDEEMLGRPLATIFTPEDRAAGRAELEMQRAADTGRASDMRWHERKDGSRFFAHGSINPILGPSAGYVKSFRDATKEHLTECALRESEDRYQSLFTSIDAGFCIIDIKFDKNQRAKDYWFVEVNPAFAANTGLKDVVGKSIRELVPGIEQSWIDIFAKVATTGESTRFESHAEALGNRWYDVYAYRIGDPGLRRVAILFTDISTRKRAELDLRISEARLDNALAISALGTFDWNTRTDTVVLSDRAREIFGFGPGGPLRSADLMARLHPEDYQRNYASALASLKTQERRTVEYRVEMPDGSRRYVKSVSDIATGERERLIGVVEDVTQQRLAAQRLQQLNENLEQRVKERSLELLQSETRFRAYFDASPEYLYLLRFTPAGALIFEDVNPAGAEFYGLSRENMIGRSPHEIDSAEAAASINSNARLSLQSGKTLRYEIRRAFGPRPNLIINTIVAPIETSEEDGGLVLVCGRDLTEQRQIEEALRQSQKMEAIGQLTGGIAHDFNNLLAAVMGSLELMQTRIKQGRLNELDRFVQAAQAASKRAAALTHRLLAFSRRQTLSPTLTDLNRLVKSMEELVRRTIGPQIELQVAAPDALWRTPVDQNQLENALLNLCINARDAMPHGGRVTIETSNFVVDERMAREGDISPGQYVTLSVSDTGTGMTPEVMSRAFEPFFTTKPMGSGTGLGLSMIYGFVRQSAGQVRIYSEIGRGSTVCIYLPRFLDEGASAEAATELGEAPRANPGEVVLVVDDEEAVRMLVVEVLKDLGYESLEAEDGTSGLKILQSNTRIDLLVTDVGLPGGMNGRQLADAARSVRSDLKVLFITGYAENAVINQGHLEPGMQIMTKPFAMEALGTKIRAMIEEHAPARAL
jgi:PAS domain S-box-containing protein